MFNRKRLRSLFQLSFFFGFILMATQLVWAVDFTDNGDGTVTDEDSGLTWLKNAGCADLNASDTTWQDALNKANALADTDANDCGLEDDSVAGDWRLPNRRELWSLIDYMNDQPPGDPFENVINNQPYWTSTTIFSTTDDNPAGESQKAWTVTMGEGTVTAIGLILDETEKTSSGAFIWPVKGTTSASQDTPVARTGQTVAYPEDGSRDDGDLQNGVAWPNPRFTINGNGTVTDNLTGLVWLEDANCDRFGQSTWNQANSTANMLMSGQCGLSDGSQNGKWRIPRIRELESLVSAEATDPALPDTAGDGEWAEGDAFKNVQSSDYWSSTKVGGTGTSNEGYVVNLEDGEVKDDTPTATRYGWPVRDFVTCRGDSEPDRDVDGVDLADYADDYVTPDPVDLNDPPLVVFARNFGKVVECPSNG